MHLSSQKKETKLQSQIAHVQVVLEAFGNARTHLNTNASRFGKYVELQFNERGRMVGAKLLNYLFDKARVTQCPGNEQNYHIFYQLLGGASTEEKQILQLAEHDDATYTYVPRTMAAAGGEAQQFKLLKQAMRTLGINKKYQARIWQLIACLLHLGQLQFIDDPTVREAAIVKNAPVLDLCADFLGVDPQALENILTYKTKLIKKDVTTVILDAQSAAKQRDEVVTALYSLLFTWLVEYMNTKLCCDTVHNFIGVLDLPGSGSGSGFNSFCVNLANERLHNFVQRSIFEVDVEEYRMEGLPVVDVPYFNNQPCVELLTRHKHGLSDIINHYSKSSFSDNNNKVLDTFGKYNSTHASFGFRSSETGQRFFSVQHFGGQVTYNPADFLESNRDSLNADLVQLIRGSETTPASYNSFVLELFADNKVRTETHPKQTTAILNAQQPSGPLRGPSMRRSKSTKRRRSTLEPATIAEEKEKGGQEKQVSATSVSMLLSQLNKALDDLFATLDETEPWFIFCIRPNDALAPNQFDSNRVRAQMRAYGIPHIATRLATHYTVSYFYDEFLERYANTLAQKGLTTAEGTQKEQCEAAMVLFAWSSEQAELGASKVYTPLYFTDLQKKTNHVMLHRSF